MLVGFVLKKGALVKGGKVFTHKGLFYYENRVLMRVGDVSVVSYKDNLVIVEKFRNHKTEVLIGEV